MGKPAKFLGSYADAYDIDVIVMGRVGPRGIGRLVGSTVEHLLYKMPCSVWVVSPEELADWDKSRSGLLTLAFQCLYLIVAICLRQPR